MKQKQLEVVKDKMVTLGLPIEQVEKEASFALQIINNSKYVKQTDQESVSRSILNIANLGLSLNPASNEAYLIPRYNRDSRLMDWILQPSYRGLVKLVIEHSDVTQIITQVVYSNDVFEMNVADNENPIKHSPCLDSDRGNKKGVYSIAIFANGSKQVEWLSIADAYKIREKSDSYKSYVAKDGKIQCVWIDWEDEMLRKSVLKRFTKYLPKASTNLAVQTAIEIDNNDFGASPGQIEFIEWLLEDCPPPPYKYKEINEALSDGLTANKAQEIIYYLQNNNMNTSNATETIRGGGQVRDKDLKAEEIENEILNKK